MGWHCSTGMKVVSQHKRQQGVIEIPITTHEAIKSILSFIVFVFPAHQNGLSPSEFSNVTTAKNVAGPMNTMSSYKKYFPSKTSFSLRQNHFRVLRVATASRGFGWINRISFVIEWNMTSEPHFSQKLSADWMPRNHVTKYCKGSLEVSNTLLCRGLRMLGRAGSAKHTDSHCVNIQWHKLELLTPENAPHDFTTPKQIYPRGPAVAYRPLAPSQSIHFYTYTVHCTTALSFKARSSHWGPLTGPTA